MAARQQPMRSGRGRLVLVGLLFGPLTALTLVASVAVHLDRPVVRRVVSRIVESVLGSEFAGSIRIGAIEELGVRRLVASDIRIDAPDGRNVLLARRLTVDGPGWMGLASLLGSAPTLVLPAVTVSEVDVDLALDESGRPGLARAFAERPRPPARPGAPQPARTTVWLKRIELPQVHVHGDLPGGRRIDASIEGLLGSMRFDPSALDLELTATALHERAWIGSPIELTTRAEAHLPRDEQGHFLATRTLSLGVDGAVAGSPVRAHLRIDGDRVSGGFEAPRIGHDQLSALLPTLPLAPPSPMGFVATLGGTSQAIRLDARVVLPARTSRDFPSGPALPGSLEVRARFLPADGSLAVDAIATEFDLASLSPDWGESRLAGRTSLRVDTAGAAVHGGIALAASEIAPPGRRPIALPPASGILDASPEGTDLRLRIDEPGSPGEALVRIGATRAVDFALHAIVPAVGAVTRLAAAIPAAERLTGSGELLAVGRLAEGHLDARADATIRGLGSPSRGLRVAKASVASRLRGPLDALEVDARLRGESLSVAGRSLPTFSASAHGPLAKPRLRADLRDAHAGDWSAAAELDTARSSLRDLTVELSRAGTALKGRVDAVDFGRADDIRVRNIVIGGDLGAPVTGDLRIQSGEIAGQLRSDGIDVAALGRLMGSPLPLRGSLDLDIDVQRTGSDLRVGYAELTLRDGGAPLLEGIDAEVSLDFHGRRIVPRVEVAWRPPATEGARCGEDDLLALEASGDVELGGPLLAVQSWRHAVGRVELEKGRIELGCVHRLIEPIVPRAWLPFESLDGTLQLGLVAHRTSAHSAPTIERARIQTRGFHIAAPVDAAGGSPWTSDRLDGRLDLSVDGSTGALHLVGSAFDARHGTADPLATLTVATTIDPAWLSTPPSRSDVVLAASTTPFAARLEIPHLDSRAREALPTPWRTPLAATGGTLTVDARATGTLLRPEGALRARMEGLVLPSLEPDEALPPLHVETMATYRDGRGNASTWIELPDRDGPARRVALIDVSTQKSSLTGFGLARRPRIDAHAKLDSLPLAALPALARRGVSGSVSGNLTLHDDGSGPQLSMRLHGDGVRLGSAVLDRARLDVRPSSGGNRSEVTSEATFVVRDGGSLSARARGALRWTDGLPGIDPDRPASLELGAERFALRSMQPLMPSSVTRVDGRLDGRLTLGAARVGDEAVTLTSALRIDDGVLVSPEYGQDLSSISGRILARPGQLSIENLDARTPSGRLRGRLAARVAGLRLIDFTGQLEVPAGDELPLALHGQALGTLRGMILIRGVRRDPQRVDIDVTAADLHLRLPPSPRSGRTRLSPQALEAHPDVHVRQPVAAPVAPLVPSERVAFNVVLRNTTVEGSAIRLVMSTDADNPIRATGGDDVSGELLFEGGELKLMGKTFEVDRGVVRLRPEEPGNPYVNMTAHWSSPDGTVVFVDYVGTIKPLTRDKLRFRSNPPRSEDAILGLFVFGDTYDLSGTASTDAQRRATQALGGVLAAEVNQLFGDLLPGLSAGLGATAQGYTSTTVSYQFSDRLSAQATVEQAPGSGPLGILGATSGSGGTTTTAGVSSGDARTKFGIDWRIGMHWLLRGALGVSGGAASGVDLLYQLRY